MIGPINVSDSTKLSRYILNGGESLVNAAIECMRKSEAEDQFLLGKAEGLILAIAHESGASADFVRDHVCDESF